MITGKTKLLGVIGDPVEHSLSPVMHNAAIAHLALDYIYLPFPIKPADLEKAIAGFQAIGLVGFSVTIPHKQAIIPLLSQVSPAAKMIGAVNTVVWTQEGWSGTNTDVAGFIAPLKQLKREWAKITPVVLGNGGAARAVVVGCAELGCPEIRVVGRNKEKLDLFKQSFADSPLNGAITVHSVDELPGLVSGTELLVNATPVGMYPNVEKSALEVEVIEKIQQGAIAYDLIYNPRPTKWLKEAEKRGAIVLDGLEMLVQQGAAALEMWLQKEVPVAIMRQSLLQQV